MNDNVKQIKEMNLADTNDGKISVNIVPEPYGAGSDSVVSIGVSLQSTSSEPDWKVHIPKGNIDAIVEALQEAKKSL